MTTAKENSARYAVVTDYWYEISDDQIRHGLSMTPLERLSWLDEARRFMLMLREAPRTYYRDGVPGETVMPVIREPD
jgi:hypothetical protein